MLRHVAAYLKIGLRLFITAERRTGSIQYVTQPTRSCTNYLRSSPACMRACAMAVFYVCPLCFASSKLHTVSSSTSLTAEFPPCQWCAQMREYRVLLHIGSEWFTWLDNMYLCRQYSHNGYNDSQKATP